VRQIVFHLQSQASGAELWFIVDAYDEVRDALVAGSRTQLPWNIEMMDNGGYRIARGEMR
jgi:hypothetical protein